MKKAFLLLFVSLLILVSCEQKDTTEIDAIINKAIDDHVFPGAVLIVGNSESVIYQKAYGHFTYDSLSQNVSLNSIFDLASLSKVFGTGMCLMKAIDSGLVDPEAYMVDYLPEMNNHGKDSIKIKHLLMHISGMHSYSQKGKTPEETWDIISNLSLPRAVGEYKYSCLNFITLMKVLESVTNEAMWKFYRDVYTEPMGLENTMYSPSQEYQENCLPTIGDSSGTKIKLQGKVHDPLALSLEGYSGNAGLFSTGPDLAKLCQLMMNKGNFDGKKYVTEETWSKFVTQQHGSRSWAWGMNNYKGSSAGSKLKETAFGHTGYTGTCAWLDTKQDIFIVFLTNRVYPRDQKAVSPTRRAVNDAVVDAFIGS